MNDRAIQLWKPRPAPVGPAHPSADTSLSPPMPHVVHVHVRSARRDRRQDHLRRHFFRGVDVLRRQQSEDASCQDDPGAALNRRV